MARWTLGKGAASAIHRAVAHLFSKVKARYLGPDTTKLGDKRIMVGYRPSLTLPGLYNAAAAEERSRPDDGMTKSLVRVAEAHLDASQARTQARVVTAVEHFLRDAENKGIDTDVATVLGGKLADLWGQTTAEVHKILDTEATHARNMGTLEGVTKVAAAEGIEDPVVYFIIVRDGSACDECVRLHMMEDGITPRVWLLSEVGAGYHQRGDDNPKLGGLHPHCRCSMAHLLDNFGFKGGALMYIRDGYKEIDEQRGMEKSEDLNKALHPHLADALSQQQQVRGPDVVHDQGEITPSDQKQHEARLKKVMQSPKYVGELSNVPGRQIKAEVKAGGKRYLLKPYHANTFPSDPETGGWNEITSRHLYGLAGMGHLHQDVHVAQTEAGPMLAIHMKPGVKHAEKIAWDTLPSPEARADAHRIGVMDFLIHNEDRHGQNLMVSTMPDTTGLNRRLGDPSKSPLAIDHGKAFTYDGDWYVKSPYNATNRSQSLFGGDTPPDLSWWRGVSSKVRAGFEDRLGLIKNKRLREHMRYNFNIRADRLDHLAQQPSISADDWQTPVETRHRRLQPLDPAPSGSNGSDLSWPGD